ncbi:ATP synthase subunit e, mitochondrial [[Candida] anglica]|uniref:ATP synthase F(0) complex subunit e, mitochondrial n=1 Tax=[Candida] anglica TaxID=148631 RepID=A0ABP0EC74_9ASCO
MSTFNVLRYSALGAGLVYGAVHRYNLFANAEQAAATAQFQKEEKLIRQAKAEYARLNAPKKTVSAAGTINWEDPNLDIGQALEGLISKLE